MANPMYALRNRSILKLHRMLEDIAYTRRVVDDEQQEMLTKVTDSVYRLIDQLKEYSK